MFGHNTTIRWLTMLALILTVMVGPLPATIEATPPLGPIACTEGALRDAASASGTIDLPPACTYTLTTDLPDINSDITINGNGAIIDGDYTYRAFYAPDAANVTLNNLTVRNGLGGSNGGGVWARDGNVMIINSTFSGNSTGWGDGGGVYAESGDVTIINSTFSENSTGYHSIGTGGGVCAGSGNVTIINSTFSNNWADYRGGGGVWASKGTVTITNSIFSGNLGGGWGGGGVHAGSGAVAITDSTFSGNTAGGGGGIDSGEGDVTIINSTFSENLAYVGGGGVNAWGKNVTITNSTFSHNSAYYFGGGGVRTGSTLNLKQSIMVGNSAESSSDIEIQNGTFNSQGYNLIGDDNDGALPLDPTDIVNPALRLGTFTGEFYPLPVSSSALDAVPPDECATAEDQRGVSRPQGAACDIGAVEME